MLFSSFRIPRKRKPSRHSRKSKSEVRRQQKLRIVASTTDVTGFKDLVDGGGGNGGGGGGGRGGVAAGGSSGDVANGQTDGLTDRLRTNCKEHRRSKSQTILGEQQRHRQQQQQHSQQPQQQLLEQQRRRLCGERHRLKEFEDSLIRCSSGLPPRERCASTTLDSTLDSTIDSELDSTFDSTFDDSNLKVSVIIVELV